MKSHFNYVLGATVLSLFLFSCNTNRKSEDEKENENKKIVLDYIHAVESKDIAKMAELLSDNYEGYGPSINDTIDKKGALESWEVLSSDFYKSLYYKEMEIVPISIKEGSRKGDYIGTWGQLKITLKNGSQPAVIYINMIYKIEDGKIVRTRTFYNEADAWEQFGL